MCTFDLKYDDYSDNLTTGLQSLLESTDLSDITLAAEGKFYKAHQVVLSIFSPYFKELFSINNYSRNMIFFMKNVKHRIVGNILTFMYEGSVQIPAEDVQLFMDTANELRITGLTNGKNNEIPESVPTIPSILKNAQAVKREVETENKSLATKRRKIMQSFEELNVIHSEESSENFFNECESENIEEQEHTQETLETKMDLVDLKREPNAIDAPVKSTRGQPLYADDQRYIYTLQRKAAVGSTWHWACEKKGTKLSCGGRIWTEGVDGRLLKIVKGHNHAPHPGRWEALQVIEQIRRQAATTDRPAGDIISACISELPPDVSASLPNMDSIKRTIRLARRS